MSLLPKTNPQKQKIKQRLELLAQNKSIVWEKIYKLIDEMNANAYNSAVKQLKELHELSKYQGEIEVLRGL